MGAAPGGRRGRPEQNGILERATRAKAVFRYQGTAGRHSPAWRGAACALRARNGRTCHGAGRAPHRTNRAPGAGRPMHKPGAGRPLKPAAAAVVRYKPAGGTNRPGPGPSTGPRPAPAPSGK